MKLAMIILAAGCSRRFGSNKLLYPVEGIPMFRRTLTQVMRAASFFAESTEEGCSCSVTVVTQYEEVEAAAREAGAEVLWNPHPEEGISSSLKLGLGRNREADACLFVVSDQPWLRAETIRELLTLFMTSGKGIACTAFGNRLGNPCVFSRKYYPELMQLTGEVGGKHVVTSHRADTAVLRVPDGRELEDLDRPPDIRTHRQKSP